MLGALPLDIPCIRALAGVSPDAMAALPLPLRAELTRRMWADEVPASIALEVTTPRDAPEVAMVQVETASLIPGVPFKIKFAGEPASGEGLRRAWLVDMARASAKTPAVTREACADGLTPSDDTDAQTWYRLGILVGTCLLTGEVLGQQLCTAAFAGALGTADRDEDMYATIDRGDYKSRIEWILNASPEEWEDAGLELREVSCVTGEPKIAPPITYGTRSLYVTSFCGYNTRGRYRAAWAAMREGAASILGEERVEFVARNFRAAELRMLVCGDDAPIDVDVMERDAIYMGGLTQHSMPVQWLWRWARSEPRNASFLLEFMTGAAVIPSSGLAALPGYGGATMPFSVCRADGGAGQRLPHASTCLNRLMLPPYATYEALSVAMEKVRDNGAGYDEAAVSGAMPSDQFM